MSTLRALAILLGGHKTFIFMHFNELVCSMLSELSFCKHILPKRLNKYIFLKIKPIAWKKNCFFFKLAFFYVKYHEINEI